MRVVKTLLQRCGDVVAFMAAASGPQRLSLIAAALDLPKSATHRLLRELCTIGWVEQDGVDGPYRLTLRFALLGHRVLRATGMPDLVQPVLDALASETGELVRLTIATDTGLEWFASAQGARSGLVYQPAIGGNVALHATANGKAHLATMSETQAMRLARAGGLGMHNPTPHTIATAAALKAELTATRQRGYGIAQEEAEPGITSIAVSIRGASGAGLGTVSVGGPTFRIHAGRTEALVAALHRAANALATVAPKTPVHIAERNAPQDARHDNTQGNSI